VPIALDWLSGYNHGVPWHIPAFRHTEYGNYNVGPKRRNDFNKRRIWNSKINLMQYIVMLGYTPSYFIPTAFEITQESISNIVNSVR